MDWVFVTFVTLSGAMFGWRLITERRIERAFAASADCFTRADVACAGAALVRLRDLGAAGPRLETVSLGIRLLADGPSGELAGALASQDKETALRGQARIELLLLRGDAAAAVGSATKAREYWSTAQALGAAHLVEPRLDRLSEQEQARAEKLRADAEHAESERSERMAMAAQQDEARQSQAQMAMSGAAAQLQSDFDAAIADANDGNVEQLRIHTSLVRSQVGGVNSAARVRFSAAVSALDAAGWAAQSAASRLSSLQRIQNDHSTWIVNQRAEWLRQMEADKQKRDSAIGTAKEEFYKGMAILRALPVEIVKPAPVRVMQLGAR